MRQSSYIKHLLSAATARSIDVSFHVFRLSLKFQQVFKTHEVVRETGK